MRIQFFVALLRVAPEPHILSEYVSDRHSLQTILFHYPLKNFSNFYLFLQNSCPLARTVFWKDWAFVDTRKWIHLGLKEGRSRFKIVRCNKCSYTVRVFLDIVAN
jgi:hypothetical protein